MRAPPLPGVDFKPLEQDTKRVYARDGGCADRVVRYTPFFANLFEDGVRGDVHL